MEGERIERLVIRTPHLMLIGSAIHGLVACQNSIRLFHFIHGNLLY